MHEQGGRAMCHAIGMHPFEQAKIVDMLGDMRKKITYPLAALAILAELPRRLKNAVLCNLACLCQDAGIIEFDHLAIVLPKSRQAKRTRAPACDKAEP